MINYWRVIGRILREFEIDINPQLPELDFILEVIYILFGVRVQQEMVCI